MAKNKIKSPTSPNIVSVLLLLVFLDTTGVALIIIQIMPRLMKLGATPLIAGFIGSVYGAVQLFSSPIVGNWGDRMDRKHILLGSILLSASSYFLLGLPNLVIFTISRFLSGLAKHTHSMSMACISDLVKSEEKGKYFGFFGGCIGAGFILGPVVGGYLAGHPDGFQLMSYLTTFVFILNFLLIWKYLPEMKKQHVETNKSANSDKNPKSNSRLENYLTSLGIENCWDVFLLQGLLEIGMMINFTNIGFIMETDYERQPKDLGMFIGALSLIGVATSALTSKITKFLGSDRITWIMSAVTFAVYAILSFRPTFNIFLFAMMISCISTTILRNGWAGLVTARCLPEKSGKVIGVLHSVAAIAGMLAPIIGGIATELSGTCHSTTLITTFFVFLGSIACIWFPRPLPKKKQN